MNIAKTLSLACSATLIASLFAVPASAFEMKVRSENPVIDEAAARAATVSAAGQVGHSIPQDPNIKVYVLTRALESKIQGQMIYFHRVQLTKAVAGGEPYPVNAWVPVKTVERFGVDEPKVIREQLDATLRDFFTEMRSITPQQGFK